MKKKKQKYIYEIRYNTRDEYKTRFKLDKFNRDIINLQLNFIIQRDY